MQGGITAALVMMAQISYLGPRVRDTEEIMADQSGYGGSEAQLGP